MSATWLVFDCLRLSPGGSPICTFPPAGRITSLWPKQLLTLSAITKKPDGYLEQLVPKALLRGPAAFRPVLGESARVRRQVSEMPFNRPVLTPTSAIEPNPENPLKHFDEAALNELASNMKEIGQLHPCIFTPLCGEQYQIVAGERRWRAAVRAGMPEVWCIVRPNLSTLDRRRTAISENQMREDFTQADRVAALDALQALVEDAGLRGAGRALGISAGWLSRQL